MPARPTTTKATRAILAEGTKGEARMSRAFLRIHDRIRERVMVNDIAMAITLGRARAARLLPAAAMRDAQAPLAVIARDAVLKGGRIAASIVRGELKA